MSTIYLMRHGQSQHNAALIHGTEFVPVDELGSELTAQGRKEAQAAAQQLQDQHFDAIYSSDLRRAHQTALIIAQPRNIPVTTLPTLRERHWGSLHGKNYGSVLEEMEKRRGELKDFDKMKVKLVDDMESEWDGAVRLQSVLNELAESHPNQQLLVVSHGNTMRAFLTMIGFCEVGGLPTGSIRNCGYAVLQNAGADWKVAETWGIRKSDI
jgi:broad specificity phosphatase PhoE